MHRLSRLAPQAVSRREFLRRGSLLSLAATSGAPLAMSLATMGEAAAANASDYKALVCVFLEGGNDDTNTLIPYDSASHDLYRSFRSDLAIDRSTVAGTLLTPSQALPSGRQFALAPGLAPLVPLFDAGAMSVILNIGSLVQPTSKAQYLAKSVPLPPQLFSHNDQQSYWQASAPEGASSGWGGRMGDLFLSGTGEASFNCISGSGNTVFLSGHTALQYQISAEGLQNGAMPIKGVKEPLFGSSTCSQALLNLMTATRPHAFENEYAAISRRSIDAASQLVTAMAGSTVTTAFPQGNSLATQLNTVARMIAARQALGAKRQVFFVSLPGFDHHSGLLGGHPGLMVKLGSALAAFYQATVDLGVASQVTTFTGSEFGRSLVSNAGGSDHGWGGMQFVLGGSVLGKSYVGTAPILANNGPDDVGEGRLLPTIGIEQFGATLAKWFGVADSDLPTVFPNLRNFSVRNLGFMA